MNVKHKKEDGGGETNASAEDGVIRGGGFKQH
jgi:hypothetical protein